MAAGRGFSIPNMLAFPPSTRSQPHSPYPYRFSPLALPYAIAALTMPASGSSPDSDMLPLPTTAASLPPNMPRGQDVLTSLITALDKLETVPPDLKTCLCDHLRSYSTNLPLTPPATNVNTAALDAARYQNKRSKLAYMLRRQVPRDLSHIKRLRKDSGPSNAPVGNLLFYPPDTSREEGTLVKGPDTTNRMLAFGLDDVNVSFFCKGRAAS